MEFLLSDRDLEILSNINSGWDMPESLRRRRVKEMLMLRFEEKWPLQKIAKRYGISRERVRQIIGNTGKGNGGFNYGSSIHLRDIVNKDEYFREKTVTDVADEFGVSYAAASSIMRKFRHKVSPDDKSAPYLGYKWEEWTSEQLAAAGIKNKTMPLGHAFDILALDTVRIDVKSAVTPWHPPSVYVAEGSSRWRFAVRKGKKRKDADFYCLVIANSKDVFVVPSHVVPKRSPYIYITWPSQRNWSKYIHYHNRYDLIVEFAENNAHSI